MLTLVRWSFERGGVGREHGGSLDYHTTWLRHTLRRSCSSELRLSWWDRSRLKRDSLASSFPDS